MNRHLKDQLLLNHPQPSVFFKSQWQKVTGPSIPYCLYRWMIALFILVMWVYSIYNFNRLPNECDINCKFKWMVFVTHWSYTVLLVQAMVVAIGLTCWMRAAKGMADRENEPFCCRGLYRVYWGSYYIATDAAFVVSVVYWTFVFDNNKEKIDFTNIAVHGLNSVIVLLDLLIVDHPFYFFHYFLTGLYFFIYSLFTGLYYAAGGTTHKGDKYLYKILDWSKPKITVGVLVGTASFSILTHALAYGMQRFRLCLYHRIKGRRYSVQNTTDV